MEMYCLIAAFIITFSSLLNATSSSTVAIGTMPRSTATVRPAAKNVSGGDNGPSVQPVSPAEQPVTTTTQPTTRTRTVFPITLPYAPDDLQNFDVTILCCENYNANKYLSSFSTECSSMNCYSSVVQQVKSWLAPMDLPIYQLTQLNLTRDPVTVPSSTTTSLPTSTASLTTCTTTLLLGFVGLRFVLAIILLS